MAHVQSAWEGYGIFWGVFASPPPLSRRSQLASGRGGYGFQGEVITLQLRIKIM